MPPAPTLMSMPAELLQAICMFLPQQGLRSLMLCNSILSEVAVKYLYMEPELATTYRFAQARPLTVFSLKRPRRLTSSSSLSSLSTSSTTLKWFVVSTSANSTVSGIKGENPSNWLDGENSSTGTSKSLPRLLSPLRSLIVPRRRRTFPLIPQLPFRTIHQKGQERHQTALTRLQAHFSQASIAFAMFQSAVYIMSLELALG